MLAAFFIMTALFCCFLWFLNTESFSPQANVRQQNPDKMTFLTITASFHPSFTSSLLIVLVAATKDLHRFAISSLHQLFLEQTLFSQMIVLF